MFKDEVNSVEEDAAELSLILQSIPSHSDALSQPDLANVDKEDQEMS